MSKGKFHVNGKGQVGKCEATKVACQFGHHSDSAEESAVLYEREMMAQTVTSTTKQSAFASGLSEGSHETFPTPQANSPSRIAAVTEAVHRGATDVESVQDALNLDERDARYYLDAAGYLGLVDKTAPGEYETSPAGEALSNADTAAANRMMSEAIQNTPEYQQYKTGGDEAVANHMSSSRNLGEETIARRMATAESWRKFVGEVKSSSPSSSTVAEETEEERTQMQSRIAEAKANREKREAAKRAREEAAKPKFCPNCFMQLPPSGTCVNCE